MSQRGERVELRRVGEGAEHQGVGQPALVAGDRMKNAFISHVSYELRTPLTNIIGFSDLLGNPHIGQLNENTRACLTLAFVEGRSHDEIARLTTSPLGSVKSWIRRGLLALKECLSSERQPT